tara:strand:+ start:150 stop:647 length:498 start_codon:yes stop_codon:yes gene_type:complete
MKKTLIVISTLLMFSCDQFNKSNPFQSNKLRGKYKVDLAPFINESTKSKENDNEWSKLEKGIASLALSSVKIELNFYDENKGLMHVDGGLLDLTNALLDNPANKIQEFNYKVEYDSILYIKTNQENNYKKWAIIQKYSDNYDYLKFLIILDGMDKVYFNLNKVSE